MRKLKVYMTRSYSFSMSHIIPADVVPAHLSQIHGHNYEVSITVKRDKLLCEEWGFHAHKLDDIVRREILSPFHGGMVNEHCLTGSSEHLCEEILKRLRNSPIGLSVVRAELKETRKNTIECVAI